MRTTAGGQTTLINVTIAGNTANSATEAGGLMVYGKVDVQNSIIAGNTNDECGGDLGLINSLGDNIESDTSCGFTETSDQQSTDPTLGSLQDNGGLTWTMALLPGSPAIDTGNNTACAAVPVSGVDQRGWTRPIDADGDGKEECDIGAYEKTIDLYLPLVVR